MVTAVKAKIDGMVDSPGFKWGLLGAAVIGVILVMPWQFANPTVLRMRAVGSVILVLTAGAGLYRVKRVWDSRQADQTKPEKSAPEEFLSRAAEQEYRFNGRLTEGIVITSPNVERGNDPSRTIVERGGKRVQVPGKRAHPTAGGYCEDNL